MRSCDEIIIKDQAEEGCDKNGYCAVEDDPNPADSCDSYESDYTCYDCGVDLNVSDCECKEGEE